MNFAHQIRTLQKRLGTPERIVEIEPSGFERSGHSSVNNESAAASNKVGNGMFG